MDSKATYTVRLHHVCSKGYKIFECRRNLSVKNATCLRIQTGTEPKKSFGNQSLARPDHNNEVTITTISGIISSGIVYEGVPHEDCRLRVGDILCSLRKMQGSTNSSWRPMSLDKSRKALRSVEEQGLQFYTTYFAQPPPPKNTNTATTLRASLPMTAHDVPTAVSPHNMTAAQRNIVDISAAAGEDVTAITVEGSAKRTTAPTSAGAKRSKKIHLDEILNELIEKKVHTELLKKLQAEQAIFQELRGQTKANCFYMMQRYDFDQAEVRNKLVSFTCPLIPAGVAAPKASQCQAVLLQRVISYANSLKERNADFSTCLDAIRQINQQMKANINDFKELLKKNEKDRETAQQATREEKDLEAALATVRASLQEAKTSLTRNGESMQRCLEASMELITPEY